METVIINIITPPPEPVTVDVIEEQDVEIEVTEVVEPVVVNVSQVGEQGPPGPSGSLDKLLFGESPIGLVDGSNATFTTPFNFVPGKLEVFINGLLQKLVTHYQTTGVNTIIFNDSPQPTDIILLNFIKP